ncbi:hypothetical protein T492DRAFT_1139737 [Pavlovales sp. CCMP2436]|nr:hypothetical protein T492DRAFT_1139737 [Pavlovales sp. CCMP2436]
MIMKIKLVDQLEAHTAGDASLSLLAAEERRAEKAISREAKRLQTGAGWGTGPSGKSGFGGSAGAHAGGGERAARVTWECDASNWFSAADVENDKRTMLQGLIATLRETQAACEASRALAAPPPAGAQPGGGGPRRGAAEAGGEESESEALEVEEPVGSGRGA